MGPSRKYPTWMLVPTLVFAGWAARADTSAGTTTTVILVRHAEKADGSRDPDLSESGIARATELARVLADVEVHALYASQFRRTQQTLDPVGERRKLPVEVFPVESQDVPAYARRLAGRLLDAYAGKTVLVAGHSNTVPTLIEALGIASAPSIDESDYDDLFLVFVEPGGDARLLHLHFGAADESAGPDEP